ncbi:MAG: DUF4335 domain-containing protein [Cyanobacteria bacterium SID2]|nr:DUF4335 domain-containing protein [Cyanobacteria bacterium SID2]MBP0002716.1 DUF4335 domain-containing protein [Cyanobacteria bacterium SBC]
MFSSDAWPKLLVGAICRRYTPPTCTLVVNAKRSSPWIRSNVPALSRLRFELSFDDPRLPDEQQKTLRGDKAQLDRLCEAVTIYVRHLLAQPPQAVYAGATSRRGNWAARPSIVPLPYTADSIHLQPSGFVSHDLFLGSLTTEETGAAVRLTTLQLFDLAAALEEYAADLGKLPEREDRIEALPLWASAAAGALVALGLTNALLQLQPKTPSARETARQVSPEETVEVRKSDRSIDRSKAALPPAPTDLATPPPLSSPTVPPPTVVDPTPIDIPPPAAPPSAPVAPKAEAPPPPTTTAEAAVPAMTLTPTDEPTVSPIPPTLPQVSFENAPLAAAPSSRDRVSAVEFSEPQDIGTAFDVVPQVAETRRYFQSRWRPPNGLNQTLEYTLVLNTRGQLPQVRPLDEHAEDYYLNNIEMFERIETEVSPLDRAVRLRLVLGNDGRVQAFVQ